MRDRFTEGLRWGILLGFIVFGLSAWGPLIWLATVNDDLNDKLKHPTYHCDGSATMGYAVPGTPEAAACWIEGGKK